jgi:hypothetical protein
MSLPHLLLQATANARFQDATKLLEELRTRSEPFSQRPDEILRLIESARVNAIVQRAHLMKSLADLDARRLFITEGERSGSTWSLEA